MALFRPTPLVLGLMAAWPVLAAQPATQALDTIEITAHRSSKPLAETAPNASVVSRHKLDDQLIGSIDAATRYEPGVEVASDPSRRGRAGYTLRGIDGNRVLMLIDGVRLPEAYAGGNSNNGAVSGRDYVELDTLRAIDIVKGPTSSLYGSDAIGGVVGYRTLTADDFIEGDSGTGGMLRGFTASADRSQGATAAFAVKNARSDALLMLTRRQGHEQDNKGQRDVDGSARTVPNPQSFDSQNILARFGVIPAAGQRLALTLEQFRKSTDTVLRDTVSSPVLAQTAQDTVRRDRITLDWEIRQTGFADRLAVKLWSQKLDNADNSTMVRSGNIRRQSDYGFSQNALGLSLDADQQIGGHTLQWGTDLSRTDTSRPRLQTQTNADGSSTTLVAGTRYPNKTFPDSRADRIGLFLADSFRMDSGLTIAPALRWDQYSMTPAPDQAFANGNPAGLVVPAFRDSALSPKLGISLPFAGHYTGFLQFSSGFRAPPFDDANMAFTNRVGGYSYQILPNPGLRSETSRGVELGLKGQWASVDFGLTAYANRYRDFIDQTRIGMINGVDTYQYANIGRVSIRGLEGRASWQPAPAWRLAASFALAHGDDEQKRQPLASIAPLSGTLSVRYGQDSAGAELFLHAVAAADRLPPAGNGQPTFKPAGYATLDLTTWWNPLKNTIVRAGIFNLTDRTYWRSADVRNKPASDTNADLFTQPGRNLSASIEYHF